jgi:N-acetylmuramoyl-L-alanine amidase/putative cell wall-binding protein
MSERPQAAPSQPIVEGSTMSPRSLRRRLFGLLAAVALACTPLLVSPARASAAAPYVFIDAGHGGPYSNANVNGLAEKDVTLLVALELQQRLKSMGYRAGIDRTGDYAVCMHDIPTWHWRSDGPHLYADGVLSSGVPADDLQQRDNLANWSGADLFVSIHCNGVDDPAPQGIETFAPTFDPLGQRLSRLVQADTVSAVGATDRGAKTTDFNVIRWANMPGILIETGFLSNRAEAAKLRSPVYRWLLARGIANGIADFLATQPFTPVYPRLSGADRYGTAASVSRSGWPNGARTVLLASGANWPDALAAAPLSRKLDAPLLLTAPGALPKATAAEIARLRPSRVVVLGSEAAVSATAAAEATTAATVGTATVTAERIGGADRYETAALIAAEVGLPADGRVAVVSGRDFADALSLAPYAGRYGIPVLLAPGSTLTSATHAFLDAHRSALRGTLVVGGPPAVPSSALAGLPNVTRIAGDDRWDTNAAMARAWGTGRIAPLVANGLDFPDGVVAGAYGAKTGRPLLLVQPRVLPDRTRELIAQSAAAGRITGFTICGSPSIIPNLMDWELRKALD